MWKYSITNVIPSYLNKRWKKTKSAYLSSPLGFSLFLDLATKSYAAWIIIKVNIILLHPLHFKKVPLLIEFSVGITLKIQLKEVLFFYENLVYQRHNRCTTKNCGGVY